MDWNSIDLAKKYGFKIILRDTTEYSYLNPFTKHLIYFVKEDENIYLITTKKSVSSMNDISDIGLHPFSGQDGIDFLEKDYQIVYHDVRDKCIFTEDLFIKWKKSGEFSENVENKLNSFYRKRKIKSILSK